MSKVKTEKRTVQEDVQTSPIYFALKSKNEIYFQMASIFKEVTHGEDELTQKILSGILTENSSHIFLEKSF